MTTDPETAPVDNALRDTDPMPYGADKGIPMQDIDVQKLHWHWHKYAARATGDTPQAQVGAYIRRNLDALKLENKDLIW